MKCACCSRTGVMLSVLDGRFLCYYGCDHTPSLNVASEKNDMEHDDEDYCGAPMAYWDGGND